MGILLKTMISYEVSGCDNLIGGYIDNVPEQAEFFQVDAIYLNQMKNDKGHRRNYTYSLYSL